MSCCILYIIRCDHTGCSDTVGRRKARCEPHGNTGRLNKISKKIRHNAPAIRIFLPTAEKKANGMAGACKDDGESVSTQRQHKPSGEVDIVDPDSGGIERSDVGQLEAGDAITLVGDKELILRASGGKANKLVDIGADGVYAALHDGDGVGLPAEPHAAALLGTEFNSHAANFAVMDTCEIGAEDKYLLGAERKRNKWRRRTVNSSRDDGLGWQCASESEKRRGRRNASFQRCFRNLKGMARTDALAIVFDDIRHNDTVHHLLDALVDGRGGG